MAQVEWDESCRILLRAAREISRELGHQEVVRPLHLLLALLANVRPLSLGVAEPSWSAVKEALGEIDPPWGDVVVITPGGQTPTTKAVLLRAIDLAWEDGEPVGVEYVWSALRQCEGDLVEAVLARLACETARGGTPCFS